MFFSNQIFLNSVQDELSNILDSVAEIIIDKWRSGGHGLTGAFEDEMRTEITRIGNRVIGNIWLNDYYQWVNEGVDAEKIPFEPGSGAGSSAYIQGLVTYFQLRKSLSVEEATKAAFATANKHLKGGMPTDKSNLGFFTAALNDSESVINEGLEEAFGEALNSVIDLYQSQLVGGIKIVL